MNSTLPLTLTKHTISGRKLLITLGASIGLALLTGVTTGLILPKVAPGLSDIDWLATIITTEVYLSFIVGHLIAFGGFRGVRQQLDLNQTSWRSKFPCILGAAVLHLWVFYRGGVIADILG